MKTNEHLLSFYKNLQPPDQLPENIQWLYPQRDPEVMKIVNEFLNKFYNDTNPRKLMLGINPGRFGAGVTGVNFTAPRQLKQYCGIEHHFKDQSELSAEFIYAMIKSYGGLHKFYGDIFIGSVCPLGFVQHGKNLNYYDNKELMKTVEPFIIKSIDTITKTNIDRNTCLIIGGEKNFRFLEAMNNKYKWFEKIIPLPHPRFIMQYKRKTMDQFIEHYITRILEDKLDGQD